MVNESQSTHLITTSDGPLPANVEKENQEALWERKTQLQEAQRRAEDEKIATAFNNPCLLNTEKDVEKYEKVKELTEREVIKRFKLPRAVVRTLGFFNHRVLMKERTYSVC